jgi:hypothetical protein
MKCGIGCCSGRASPEPADHRLEGNVLGASTKVAYLLVVLTRTILSFTLCLVGSSRGSNAGRNLLLQGQESGNGSRKPGWPADCDPAHYLSGFERGREMCWERMLSRGTSSTNDLRESLCESHTNYIDLSIVDGISKWPVSFLHRALGDRLDTRPHGIV